MNEYVVKIHYTDKDGIAHTFISEKVADTEAEAIERATALFNSFEGGADKITGIEAERID